RPDERIDVVIGTLSSGQGHETSFAQLIVEWFGVDLDRVSVITGDTELAPVGGGSHSGRSMRQAGVVMAAAGDQIIERGVQLAVCRRLRTRRQSDDPARPDARRNRGRRRSGALGRLSLCE